MQHVIVPRPYPELATLANLPVPSFAIPLHTHAVFHARQAFLYPTGENRIRAAEALRRLAAAIGK